MYKNILVPLDLSHEETSEKSIQVAQRLAGEAGELTLLTIIEELPGYIALEIPQQAQARNIEGAKQKLKEIAEKHAPDAKYKVVVGHASRDILAYAKKFSSDCIIIASHKPGLEDYFMGSTASRVVRHSTCAVHVFR